MKNLLLLILIVISPVCIGKSSDVTNTTYRIDGGLYDELYEEATLALESGKYTTVELNSKGGVLYYGIKLGITIRKNNINTRVNLGDSCLSACNYIFLAGIDKTLNGRFGVHSVSYEGLSYDECKDNKCKKSITYMGELSKEYLDIIGVNPLFFDYMSLTGVRDMYYMDVEEINRFLK